MSAARKKRPEPKEYVAYTPLENKGYAPGDVVDPSNWSAEEWRYMVEHAVVVPKNSPDDPNVLQAAAEEVARAVPEPGPEADEPSSLEVKETVLMRDAMEAHAAAEEELKRTTEGDGQGSGHTPAPAQQVESKTGPQPKVAPRTSAQQQKSSGSSTSEKK
jgi:hypothetical protein